MKFCDEMIQNHLLNGGKVKRSGTDYLIRLNGNNDTVCCKHGYISVYIFKREDFAADDWEIVGPKYNWDKIIKDKILCIFSDDVAYKINTITTLVSKDEDFYYTNNGTFYVNCKPFNPADFNIAKNIKEYEND